MNRTLLPLVVALTLAGTVVQTHAQSLTRPDIGSLLDRVELPRVELPTASPSVANITTRGSVTGSASQVSAGPGSDTRGNQTLAVGSTAGLTNATGSISADGQLDGEVLQQRRGAQAGVTALQEVGVGTVGGAVTAGDVRAQGVASARITQIDNGGAAGGTGTEGVQRVDVGGIRNVSGGSIVSNGLLADADVTQFQQGALLQELRVGSVADSSLQSAQARGIVSGQISQVAASGGAPGDGQRLRVGTIDNSQAQSVRTSGSVLGVVAQQQQQGARQTIQVGAVADVDAAGSVATDGSVTGPLVQTAVGAVNQELRVASVLGGSPRSASARATVSGVISQTAQNARPEVLQRIDVATITSFGSVTTDAVVTAALQQSQTDSGAATSQLLQVARVLGGSGNISARATVQGSVTQTLANAQGGGQRIRIGSVANPGGANVTADAQVNANLLQSATGNSRESQLMSIGSVN